MAGEEKTPQAPWWQPALVLFVKLSGWIAGPIIAAVFAGKWLDNKYNTEPWLFLLTVGVSFVVSMFSMIKMGLREFKKIEEDSKKNNKIL